MRLNLGCGYDIRDGYLNIDKRAIPGVYMVFDLNLHRWPFHDAVASEILALDIFEHLDDVVAAMDECWRILKPGGLLTVRGPLAGGPLASIDVTHRRAFTERSFDHFDWSTELGAKYRYGNEPWSILDRQYEGDNVVFRVKPVK